MIMISSLQSQFTEKCFKKTENLEHSNNNKQSQLIEKCYKKTEHFEYSNDNDKHSSVSVRRERFQENRFFFNTIYFKF